MKTLKKNLENRVDAIEALLKIPRAEFTKSVFHKLRVEIKQLNAIFEVVNFCSKDFKRKKTFLPIKEIFDQAGKVRELQVEEATLDKYLSDKSLLEYRKNLEDKCLVEKSSFFELLGKKLDKRLKNKFEILIPFLDQVNKKKAIRFIEEKKGTIESLINVDLIKEEDLHKLRKYLKLLDYTFSSLSFKKESVTGSEEHVLIDLLGKWHDSDVILDNLRKALESKNIEMTEIGEIEELKSKIALEKEKLLEEINLAIRQSIFFHGNISNN
jgi:CHAD domain-containing protein